MYSADRFEIVPDGDSDHHETNPQAHLVHLQFPTRDILEVPLFVRENSAKLVVLVNHWPSRRAGRYESEPYRISVANHCACIVQCHPGTETREKGTVTFSRDQRAGAGREGNVVRKCW